MTVLPLHERAVAVGPGAEVRIDGQNLLIMQEPDIMGVIERAAASERAA